ncbi:hypothetical protein D026_1260B, partial [Vibrio parahaemolyticus 605]
HLLMD